MKKKAIRIFTLIFILVPVISQAIIFKKKDDKGVYYFLCDGFATDRIKIKLIDKNTYKALGAYVGKVIKAETAFEAAQEICGERKSPGRKGDN